MRALVRVGGCLVAAASSVAADTCSNIVANLGCNLGPSSSSACSSYLALCFTGGADNPECCSPAFVSYNYVSAGVTLEATDLVALEKCSLNYQCLGSSSLCQAGDLVPYDNTFASCSNKQALPQLLTGPSCASGMLCDFTIALCNMSTWPQYCSPDVDCTVDLLQYQFCDSQLHYEPRVCPEGKFCTRKSSWEASSTSSECPEGSYCPVGTETPVGCEGMVRCSAASSNPVQYGCFVYMLLVDALLFAYLHRRGAWQLAMQASVMANKGKARFGALHRRDGSSDAGVALLGDGGGGGGDGARLRSSSESTSTYHLVRGFTRARGRIFSLDFEFDRLGLILPSGNAILQSVSARVQPGCVTAIMVRSREDYCRRARLLGALLFHLLAPAAAAAAASLPVWQGPSGAGKTTLLNTLMGKVDPSFKQTGELRINGKLRNIKDFRSVIGFVPQVTPRATVEVDRSVRL